MEITNIRTNEYNWMVEFDVDGEHYYTNKNGKGLYHNGKVFADMREFSLREKSILGIQWKIKMFFEARDKKLSINIVRDEDSKRVDFAVNGNWYHTDDDGEGLWTGSDYLHQISGTCQFNLRQKTYSGIRNAIKRWFEC